MRAIVQRINSCVLSVEGKEVSRCGFGYLVLLGFTQGDTREKADYIVNRIVTEDVQLTKARLALTEAVADTIKKGLHLLLTEAPDRM